MEFTKKQLEFLKEQRKILSDDNSMVICRLIDKLEEYEKTLDFIKAIIINESPRYFNRDNTLDQIFELVGKNGKKTNH